jgi:transposase-like protein
MGKNKSTISREEIVAEYLAGGISFRQLGKKYGKNFRKIHDWVLAYQGRKRPKKIILPKTEAPLPTDIKQLQAELRTARLHNKLLEAMIEIGREQYGIDLRKKTGAKRS